MTQIEILAPMDGMVMELEQVPDEVFAKKMAGDGLAIDITGELAVAPLAGQLVKLFPGGHAFVISTEAGVDILVHVGLDTVELKGQGFTTLAKEGDRVAARAPIVRFNREEIIGLGKNLVSPVLSISNGTITQRRSGPVHAGQDILFTLEF
ncbi:MAG TPA: glucose PTS transporter subunit IIA [Ktedonobacterales bacterium]|nr:glucose PTS transporter subunit IIA [Ktedonobacterales bacterium]